MPSSHVVLGRKILTVVHSLLAGGDSIDDVEMPRAGAIGSVLGHRVMAASTVGTWLRAFTFGHVRHSTGWPRSP